MKTSRILIFISLSLAMFLCMAPNAFSSAPLLPSSIPNFLMLPPVEPLTPEVGGAPGAPNFKPLCLPKNDSKPRLQAIYAYDTSKGISSSKLLKIRKIMQEADRIVFLSADKQGGGRRLRLATVPEGNSCQVSVIELPLSMGEMNSGSDTLNSELIASGVLADNSIEGSASLGIIPVVFFDSDPNNYDLCGLGTTSPDDAVDGVNSLPQSGQASIWAPCWNAFTAVHEVMHVLGAVQYSAPHSTGNLHCNDGIDPLCYEDGGQAQIQSYVCPSTPYRPDGLLDCNADDYFAIDPPTGSYLSNHFNIANNSPYVEAVPAVGSSWPKVTTTLTGKASALPFTGVPFIASVEVPAGFLFAGSSYTYGNDHCGVRFTKSTDSPPSSSPFSIFGVAYCRVQNIEVRDSNNLILGGPFQSKGAVFSVVDQLGRDTAGEVNFHLINSTSTYPVKDSYTLSKPSAATGQKYIIKLTLRGKGPQSKAFDTPLVGLKYMAFDQTTMKLIPANVASEMEIVSEADGSMRFSFPTKLRGHLIDLENDGLDGNVNWNLKITQLRLPS